MSSILNVSFCKIKLELKLKQIFISLKTKFTHKFEEIFTLELYKTTIIEVKSYLKYLTLLILLNNKNSIS